MSQVDDGSEEITLPIEIFYHVFRFLKPKDLILASQVCKLWYELGHTDVFWRENYFLEFGHDLLSSKGEVMTEVPPTLQLGPHPLRSAWKELYVRKKQAMETNVWFIEQSFTHPHTLRVEDTASEFPTFCANIAILVDYGKYYYEAYLEVEELMQIGWMSSDSYPRAETNANGWSENLLGVGDDPFSFAFDGNRKRKFHNRHGQLWGAHWKSGDTVGCILDLDAKTVSFSINGKDLGVAYDSETLKANPPFYAALSMQYDESRVQLRLLRDEMKFGPPEGYMAVGDNITDPISIITIYSRADWPEIKEESMAAEYKTGKPSVYWSSSDEEHSHPKHDDGDNDDDGVDGLAVNINVVGPDSDNDDDDHDLNTEGVHDNNDETSS